MRSKGHLKAAVTLFSCLLLVTCSNELEPTGAIAVSLQKGAAWPDTLALPEMATLAVTATGPGQQAITGVSLVWGSTDSSIVTVTPGTSALHAIVTSRRPGKATIVVRIDQTGFDAAELHVPVVVRSRGADSLLTVTDTVTVGITHPPGLLDGATISWGSSDPALVNVAAVAGDSTQAVVIARSSGSAQVTATVQGPAGHAEFPLPMVVRPLQLVQDPAGSWPAAVNVTNSDTVAVRVLDARGQPKAGRRVSWQSTNEAAFSVDSQGVVVAKTRGGGELVASVGTAPFEVTELRATLQVKEKWKAVSAGGSHTCAIAARDGTGYCWGWNADGQLGLGFDNSVIPETAQPGRIATSHKFSELVTGDRHSCGREGFQTLLCWGARDRGQLGDGVCNPTGMGSTCFRSSESPVTIVSGGILGGNQLHVDRVLAGGTFSCIVTVNGGTGSFASRELRCWGTSDENGRGIAFADSAAVAVVLHPGTGTGNVTEVTAGGDHLCTKTDDTWWAQCMGVNDFGQLGDGTLGNSPLPSWYPKGLVIIGGDPANPGGDGYPASSLTAGGSHTCALDAGGVLCWGSNLSGQLGANVPSDTAYPTRVALVAPVAALAAGDAHTCALTPSGSAYCWGSNSNGQLGRGTIGGSSSAPALVSGGLAFASISAGGTYTCGVTTDGSIYCWGANASGQLGDGTLTDRPAPVRVIEASQ